MNLKKALDQLRRLVDEEPNDLNKYAKVHALLSGFDSENTDVNGAMINVYSDEKIDDVRIYFCILCGIGEDGFTKEKVRENLHSSIGKLGMIISDNELTLQPPGL